MSVASAKKQAADEAKNAKMRTTVAEASRKPGIGSATKTKFKRRSQKMSALSKKKEKLYCICRTPYDDSK